jgi:hypothetical protein
MISEMFFETPILVRIKMTRKKIPVGRKVFVNWDGRGRLTRYGKHAPSVGIIYESSSDYDHTILMNGYVTLSGSCGV